MDDMQRAGSTNRLLIVDDQPGVTGVLEVTAIRLGFKVLAIRAAFASPEHC